MVHFFTDYGRLAVQTADQAYGPVAGSPTTQYRVTSLHTIGGGEANVYAICAGHLLAVESTVSGKLNLILRPTDQGEVTFAKIKFIIYRGVERDALLSGDMIADKSYNDITAYLWEEFKKTEADPGKDLLLIDLPNDEWLEVAFLNKQMIPVSAGAKIGSFKSGETFGIEFVLEKLGQEMTVGDACLLSRVIDVLPVDGTLLNKAAREKILGFMDPCSFYGMHILEGIGCRTLPQSSVSYIEETDLYQKILLRFARPNVVYVDIRNEHGYSLDYFGSYGGKIQLMPENGGSEELNYGTQGWPLLELILPEDADNSRKEKLRKKVSFSIRFPKGDNSLPLVYLVNAIPYGDYPNLPQGKEKFIPQRFEDDWTKRAIKLAISRVKSTDNIYEPVSGYVCLYYIKQIDKEQPLGNTPLANNRNHLDYLFPVLPNYIWDKVTVNKGVEWFFFHGLKYLDAIEIPAINWSGMVKTCLAKDSNGDIVFIALPVDSYLGGELLHIDQTSINNLITGYDFGKNTFLEILEYNYYNKLMRFYYDLKQGINNFTKTKVLSLSNDLEMLANPVVAINSFYNLITFCLSQTSWEEIKNTLRNEVNPDLYIPTLKVSFLNEINYQDDINSHTAISLAIETLTETGEFEAKLNSQIPKLYTSDLTLLADEGFADKLVAQSPLSKTTENLFLAKENKNAVYPDKRTAYTWYQTRYRFYRSLWYNVCIKPNYANTIIYMIDEHCRKYLLPNLTTQTINYRSGVELSTKKLFFKSFDPLRIYLTMIAEGLILAFLHDFAYGNYYGVDNLGLDDNGNTAKPGFTTSMSKIDNNDVVIKDMKINSISESDTIEINSYIYLGTDFFHEVEQADLYPQISKLEKDKTINEKIISHYPGLLNTRIGNDSVYSFMLKNDIISHKPHNDNIVLMKSQKLLPNYYKSADKASHGQFNAIFNIREEASKIPVITSPAIFYGIKNAIIGFCALYYQRLMDFYQIASLLGISTQTLENMNEFDEIYWHYLCYNGGPLNLAGIFLEKVRRNNQLLELGNLYNPTQNPKLMLQTHTDRTLYEKAFRVALNYYHIKNLVKKDFTDGNHDHLKPLAEWKP